MDGALAPLSVLGRELSFPEGQGGLSTLRLALTLEARPSAGPHAVRFADANFAERLGWREVVVRAAAGVPLLASTAPSAGVTDELRAYPADALSSPASVRTASFDYEAGRGASAPPLVAQPSQPRVPAERARGAFVSLVNVERLSLPVLLLGLLTAMGFGALHALEPGHGKTLVAAYFVGVRGTPLHALGLGLVIAATHAVGVLSIGAITLYGSRYIVPEQLYPWLSLGSGLLVVALGTWLLLSRLGVLRRGLPHVHLAQRHHDHDREEHRHDHHHVHGNNHDHDHDEGAPPWRVLVALGLVDGLVPSPSTLVVLLAAISLDRIEHGFMLIVAFSVGLAAVLAAISLGVVYARRLLARLSVMLAPAKRRGRLGRALRLARPDGPLPAALSVSAALVLVLVGVALSVRALSQPGLLDL